MSYHYASVVPATGEVVGIVTIGVPEPDEARKLISDEHWLLELSDQEQMLASTSVCYWDKEAERLVSAGVEPYQGAEFDFEKREWRDGRALDVIKREQWSFIKECRARAEDEEFVWNGVAIDSDLASRSVIMGALEMARLHPGFTIDFTAGDNSEIELDQQDLQDLLVGIASHIDSVHRTGRKLRKQIEEATTPDDVKAVSWPGD